MDASYDKTAMFSSDVNQAAIRQPISVALCPSSPRGDAVPVAHLAPSNMLPTGGGSRYDAVYHLLDKNYGTSVDRRRD